MKMLLVWCAFVPVLCVDIKASAEPPMYKLVGDETDLVAVKASPQDNFGKPITLMGKLEISDSYFMAYRDSQDTHYSFEFIQLTKSTPVDAGIRFNDLGERVFLYLSRAEGKTIADTIVQSKQRAGSTPYKVARVKVAIVRKSFGEVQWDGLELLDIQFANEKGEWQEWTVGPEREKRRAALKQQEEEAAEAARQAAVAKAAERKALDAARTRTWKDSGKTFVGKFLGVENGNVEIQTEKRTLRIPLFRFSKEDRDWVRNELKNPHE